MRAVRFTFPAPFPRVAALVLGVTWPGFLVGPAPGQDIKPPGAPVDRAREAMRREAEAKAAELQAMFGQLKVVAPPAPVPRLFHTLPQPAVERTQIITTVEEVDPDDDEAGPRLVRVYTEQAFDFYVFGGSSVEACRSHLNTRLKQEVERVARERQLTPDQQAKLLLAGKGDIKRQFDRIEEKRKEFETVRKEMPKAAVFVRTLPAFARTSWRDPWGQDSLFAKVLVKIDDDRRDADADAR